MSEKPRGLPMYFYRSASGTDCTNGGISARFDRCVLIGTVNYAPVRNFGLPPVIRPLDEWSRVFEPTDDAPAVYMVVGGNGEHDRYIIPADQETWEPDGRWWMAGGNFADASDSRIRALLPGGFAVRVHDRHEG